MRDDDALVCRQRRGALNRFKPLVDELVTTNVMLVKELLERAAPGELRGLERRPPREKVTK